MDVFRPRSTPVMTIRIGGKNDTAHPTVSTIDDSGATAPMSNAIPVQMTAMRNPAISVNDTFTAGFPSRVPTNESRILTLQSGQENFR